MFRSAVKFFKNTNKLKLVAYGALTNTVFGVGLRVTADGVQQTIENKTSLFPNKQDKEYNFKRTTDIALIGVLVGPIMYGWYGYLDNLLPGRSFKTIAKKVVIDQLIGSTGFLCLFVVGLCLLQGQSFNDGLNELIRKFPYMYLVDWLTWPTTNYLNLYVVPTQYRVYSANIILFLWNVFLSYAKYNELNWFETKKEEEKNEI